jgi:hypothetical protein
MSEHKTNPARRKSRRLPLTLPVQVKFPSGNSDAWEEITRLKQVSPLGAGLSLKHPVKVGTLIFLTMSMPQELRAYDHAQPQYNVWGLVRYCHTISKKAAAGEQGTAYEIGLAFVGKNPPENFLKDPLSLYDIEGFNEEGLWKLIDSAGPPPAKIIVNEADAKNMGRFMIPINVSVEVYDDHGIISQSEHSVTEYISVNNASVYTALNLPEGSFVRLCSDDYQVSIISVVRSVEKNASGFARMELDFIDRQFPLDGVENGY